MNRSAKHRITWLCLALVITACVAEDDRPVPMAAGKTTVGAGRAYSGGAITPGAKFPSQKIAYKDPISGKRGWRLTTMGKQMGINPMLANDLAQENTQWSPDSSYLVFNIHSPQSPYVPGIFALSVSSGEYHFLAPTGDCNAGGVFNPANPNDVFYIFCDRTNSPSTSWAEVRAVDTRTFVSRAIKKLNGVEGAMTIGVSSDGKWFSFVATTHVMGAGSFLEYVVQPVVVNTSNGSQHSMWTFNPNMPYRQDVNTFNRGADIIIWNAKYPNRAWASYYPSPGAYGKKAYINIDTLQMVDHRFGSAHAAFHPNGLWDSSDRGMSDEKNNCLSKQCGSESVYGTRGCHAFANPADGSKGTQARIICDHGSNGRLYEVTFETVANVPIADWLGVPKYAVASYFGSRFANAGHPHPQYSPNGVFVAWHSNLQRPNDGKPPGPTDSLDYTTDIFVLQLH